MYLNPPGQDATLDDLRVPKAMQLARYLESGVHPHADIVGVRRAGDTGLETVVIDLRIEVAQSRKNPILPVERIAVTFSPQDESFPEVISLRQDFPIVPHLGEREHDLARSLCLYETPYDTVKLSWTSRRFVEQIRDWLSQTSEGKLHQTDQPLEPVFLGKFLPLLLPAGFVEDVIATCASDPRIAVYETGPDPSNVTALVVDGPSRIRGNQSPNYLATVVVAEPCEHGIIQKTPKNLHELIELMAKREVDLLSILREKVTQWKEEKTTLSLRLILLMIFPKLREAGAQIESCDIWAFKLMENIRGIGINLGVWAETPESTLGAVLGSRLDESRRIAIQVLNPMYQLTKSRSAKSNGVESDERKFVMIGVGSLGSLLLSNLAKKGFGSWTVIDDDQLLPHNGARHLLPAGEFVGLPKVYCVGAWVNSYYEEQAVPNQISANTLHPGPYIHALESAFQEADVIFDCSADVPTARGLSLDNPSPAQRVSVFLNPSGEDLVLLMEDRQREIKLDELEMQYYRMLLENTDLNRHFLTTDKKLRYGRSCRDRSSVLSADAISIHAAIASRAVEKYLAGTHAAISIWKITEHCCVQRYERSPTKSYRQTIGDFTVVWDDSTLAKLTRLRSEKLPNETGGALLGIWDTSRAVVYVVDVTDAPDDSVEEKTAFIRGSKELRAEIDSATLVTGGQVGYIGEWHSHPDGYSTRPSGYDRDLYGWINEHLTMDDQTPIMLIVGKHDLRWLVGQKGSDYSWKFPN